jgi:ABC-type branched-subunit amino acid transport system permease subunit
VRRLKLFAFAVGGAIAGLSGTVFAAVQLGVFPQNFDLTLLIMIYAADVLGGAGSLPGVLLGAAVISIVPEILRDPEHGRCCSTACCWCCSCRGRGRGGGRSRCWPARSRSGWWCA